MDNTIIPYGLIWAQDSTGGIGRDGSIPWRKTPEGRADMIFFRATTKDCILICGRNTAESFGWTLSRRRIIVVSSRPIPEEVGALGVIRVSSLEEALAISSGILQSMKLECSSAEDPTRIRVWVAGGVQLYTEALSRKDYTRLCITHIPGDYACDRRMPRGLV